MQKAMNLKNSKGRGGGVTWESLEGGKGREECYIIISKDFLNKKKYTFQQRIYSSFNLLSQLL